MTWPTVTPEMLKQAEWIAGLELTDAELEGIVTASMAPQA